MEARFRQVLQRQERHGLAVSILLTLRALTTLGWVVTSTLDPPLLNNPFRSLLRGGGLFRHTSAEASPWPFWPIAQPRCIRWWVGECAACWPKFTKRVTVEWCRGMGRNWVALCSVDETGRAKPCARRRADYRTPSLRSFERDLATYIRQRGRIREN